MPDIAAHIPNVDRIEVLERQEPSASEVRLVNHWFAVSDIPTAVKGFIKPDMLAWKDTAVWNVDDHTVEWELETFFFSELVSCSGRNQFKETADGATEVHVLGDLSLDHAKVTMVPKPMRKRLARELEKFVVKLIGPNLGNAAQGVQKYLDSQS